MLKHYQLVKILQSFSQSLHSIPLSFKWCLFYRKYSLRVPYFPMASPCSAFRYNFIMKQLALIGSTASGKSDLALQLAQKHHGLILSIDSLSIYKEINIASAKPAPEELAKIPALTVYPSETNFIFGRSAKTQDMVAYLMEKRICIRNFSGDLSDCFRLSVGTSMENDALLREMRAFWERS